MKSMAQLILYSFVLYPDIEIRERIRNRYQGPPDLSV